jgi:hypothetical protein
MIKTIARFTPRPADDTNTTCDLILGKVLNQSDLIKPNHVYEIIDFFGELVLKDLGESSMGITPNVGMISDVCWGQECDNIVSDGSHLITKEEAKKIIKRLKLD